MARQTVFIAGGGTGGHIYPALAIARGLLELNSELDIHFVGSPVGLETQIIPNQGFPLHLVPIGRLNRNVGLGERLKTLVGLPLSFFVALFLLLKFRPKLLLGVGGFASAPVLFVGALCGFKTVIWEPNAYPGLANRWLAKVVGLGLVVFSEAKDLLRVKRVLKIGLPVRKEIEELAGSRRPHLGPLRILIFGGSQGARGINNTVCDAVCKGGDWLDQVEIIHQTGKHDFASVKAKYQSDGARVDVREYLPNIHEQYAWADMVICRAGVSTIAELAAAAKPAILVPFPFASDDHQQKNAEALVKDDAAVMVIQKDFTPDRLVRIIREIVRNPARLEQLSGNIRRFHQPKAAEGTAKVLLAEMAGKNSNEQN
ncbi:MAG: undecaprenyldiphospho-muramoylpentapeptide beta-N-acetylglucosaminyltransferase [Bdellovibrionaceae bacterium]|nr:undecaprenyldiphospho-muramoylpentapeptide beta-N-acetylglucosaminyltransferase [Bdellovibrionales bacterium]MCB9084783.1 undecaprenyldiphospho-muramoylpentapeptide beta-N-acetylglucosaminyltransferase [Pseudobdellovibrionaceae bacterium]